VAAAALVAVEAAQRTLTTREVDEAILIGQSRIAADRARFHAPYRITVGQAPVDYVDVITPFRRVVLAAEQRLQIGDRSFGQQQALELLQAANGQFDVIVELTFHPLNTFVGIPPYTVTLLEGTNRIEPVALDRRPRFGARLEGLPSPLPTPAGALVPSGSQPMLGGTLVARFAGDAIDVEAAMDLVVAESGQTLARTRIDLGRLR
jgi:hypothetical protein